MANLAPNWGRNGRSKVADRDTDAVLFVEIVDGKSAGFLIAVMEGIDAEVVDNRVEKLRMGNDELVLVAITNLEGSRKIF